ncbi:MAG: hypothetical protein IJ901_10045 [Bacteroidaceae bacterium]|nr:hypothetical protein [Bacteroidaceae bacterium]
MDTSNDNIRKLFDMLDNPAAYSEQEIYDIINCDEETRETYHLMVEAKRSSRWTQPQQPGDVDAAWQRFEKKHYPQRRLLHRWMRIAASFIGILFISGIAFAVLYHMQGHSVVSQVPQTEETSTEIASQEVTAPVRFDDVRLDSILSVVSAHYGKTTHFCNDEAKAMKFIMTWLPDSSLTRFIDGLNMFDGLQLTLLRDTIFVEVQEGKEDVE